MKILGYDIRPIHALYAGVMTLAGIAAPGCGSDNNVDTRDFGTKMEYRMTDEAREALNNYVFHMRQHGKMKCKPQAVSAILMTASAKDNNMTDEITLRDLWPVLAKEAKRSSEVYKDEIPGLEKLATEIDETTYGDK